MSNLNLDRTITHESAVMPGVKFTVRRLSVRERAVRDLPLVDVRFRITELYRRLEEVKDKIKAPDGKSEADLDRLRLDAVRIDHEVGLLINAEMRPAYLKASLVSVEGLPKKLSVQDLIDAQELDPLLEEIYAAGIAAAGMGADEIKNSPSPGTSQDPVPPGETNSIATAASE